MANVFASLPVPLGNGVGAAINVSSMGSLRTLVVVGAFQATLSIEVSEDGVNFGPLQTFSSPGTCGVEVAAVFMRTRVSGYSVGPLPVVAVGSTDIGTLFAFLPVPPGNGAGASVDVSVLGTLKTIIVTGPFQAAVRIDASNDGLNFSPLIDFTGPDAETVRAVTQFLRVQVSGYEGGSLPVVLVGAVNDPTAGGGGGVGILTWKNTVRVATTANIVLSGLQVIDGVALVAGDRVLVKNQVAAQDNGIYVASAGIWPRSTDADTSVEVTAGLAVIVEEGATQADSAWELTTDNPIALGVTPLAFAPLNLATTLPTTIFPDAVSAVGTSIYAAPSNHVHGITTDIAVEISDSTNAEGVGLAFSRDDHLHAHGDRGGGSLHALATILVAGFMSPADKAKLDGIQPGAGTAVIGFGSGNLGAAAGTRFLDPWFGGNVEVASTTIIDLVAPRAGTLRNMFVRHNAATGNGNSVSYTVMLNGVATALTASLATGAIGQTSDLVNSVVVAVGDRVALRAVKALGIANGAVLAVVTMEFTN